MEIDLNYLHPEKAPLSIVLTEPGTSWTPMTSQGDPPHPGHSENRRGNWHSQKPARRRRVQYHRGCVALSL